MQNYNWYSTSSQQRFKRTIINEPKITQFSDEGRFLLGSASHPENVEMRDRLIESVAEETLQKWVDYHAEMRRKCSLRKRQLGIEQEEIDEKLRTYPRKTYVIEDDLDNNSDGSQQSRMDYDRSKYVLIRKLNPTPTTSSILPPPVVESVSSDQIFVDDSQPSTSNVRWVVSGKENNAEKHATSIDSSLHSTRVATSSQESSPRKVANGTVENRSTLIVTVPSSSTNVVQECILNKYGHCFAPKVCPFAHNGVVRKGGRKVSVTSGWKRKLPNIPLCPGYLNFKCWNFDCEKRHIMYPSDQDLTDLSGI
ncbi:hypothetical protein CAEBREN_11059 [Caenorhabditis brenneri]|uniref:C3H1-type domain-containing protein n=1 Tax=Caenorhabditis brenneri TaxID=135651 RepID=G0NJS6_CAEBE|nr:hypothetical protein CAEBREN_11059 [Caenorhabditis brenneri]